MPEIDLSAQVRGFVGPSIDLSAIERDLAELWRMPTLTGLRQSDVVPTRTSVLNLVVCAGTPEQARRSSHIIEQLSAHHPSRAIIFGIGGAPADFSSDLDARVSTHCYAGAGEHFAACFEQIEINLPRESLDYLPSIIIPLALPDLPTFLWWPGPVPLTDRRFPRLAQVADRLILDSLDFQNGAADLARCGELARSLGDCPALADLNWGRLIPWRRSLAHFFDLPECRWALDQLVHVRIEYGTSAETRPNEGQALLYLGWLTTQLGWQPVSCETAEHGWRFQARDGHERTLTVDLAGRSVAPELSGCLISVRLVASDGTRDARFEIGRVGDDLTTIKTVVTQCGEQTFEHAMQAPAPELSKLLGRELEEPRRDALFAESLGEACRYATLIGKQSS